MKDIITINGQKVEFEYPQYTNITTMLKEVGTKRVRWIVNQHLKHNAMNDAREDYMKIMAKEHVIKNLARATGLSLKKATALVNQVVKQSKNEH